MTFSKLGTDTETHQPDYLPKASRLQGLYIIGIQGTGKSGLIENLIMQDIDQQIGVCVLDPHGELIDHVLARLEPKNEKDVILLDLANYTYPFGLNLFECPDPTDDGEIVKTIYQVLHVFEKAYGIIPTTPLMYDLLYNTAYALIANPGYTLIDIRLLLTNEICRKKLARNVANVDVRTFWDDWDDPRKKSPKDQQADSYTILNKLDDFSHVPLRNIVGQSKTTINLQDIMDAGKILLVKLSRRLERPSNLIGSIIIAQLLNAAYGRPTNKRKQFHLYADEFQNFATEDFATLLEEARKFGIGTTIAHQNRGQLNSANSKLETDLKDRSRSVGNLVVFKINSKDADDLAGEFDTTPPPPQPEEIGIEEVRTPVKDVVHHLLNSGSHPNLVVNQFANNELRNMQQSSITYPNDLNSYKRNHIYTQLNTILYQAMITGNIYQAMPPGFLWEFLSSFSTLIENKVDIFGYTESKHRSLRKVYTPAWDKDDQTMIQTFDLLWNTADDTQFYSIADTPYQWVVYIYQRNFEAVQKASYNHSPIDPYFAQKVYTPEVHKKVLTFIRYLRQVMQALANEPIMVGSGQWIKKMKPGPVRPFQDVKNDIANQLSGLPSFTARVKLGTNAPQNPGKKCLKCGLLNNNGDVFCVGCGIKLPAPNEYTLTTIKPAGGIGAQQLDQRIKRIQAQNRQAGYTRARQDVEAEITQRQTSCSGSAPAQPQIPQQPSPQQPPRHARQVPVQGNCPNCNASNPRGSKFCNQCGKPI